MSLHEYAEREMAIAWPESDDMQDEIKKDVLQIIDKISKDSDSSFSIKHIILLGVKLMHLIIF